MPRRATDRVEDLAAWVFVAAALLLVVAAGAVGGGVHRDGLARAALESLQRHQVPAELVADEQPVTGRFRTTAARWTGPDGRAMTGRIVLDPAPPAGRSGAVARPAPAEPGRQVAIWVDGEGRPTRPPATAAQAAQAGVIAAVALVLVGLAVLAGAWLGLRALVARRNDRYWERAWARVGPLWSRRVP